MSKAWRVVEVSLPHSEPFWTVTQKKITDEELDELWEQTYCFDSDVLGVFTSGRFITGYVTVHGTKADAVDECKRLNEGGELFDSWFDASQDGGNA